MPKWARYLIGALIVIALVLVADRILDRIRKPGISIGDDSTTIVRPKPPVLPRPRDLVVGDTLGRTERVRTETPHEADVAVRIDPPPSPDSAGSRREPVILTVGRIEPRGFFPEFTGRRAGVRVRAVQGGKLVTVTTQPPSILDFDVRPFIGGVIDTGPTPGLLIGSGILRVGPLHFSVAADVAALTEYRFRPGAFVRTTMYHPFEVGLGVVWNPRPSPALSLTVSF